MDRRSLGPPALLALLVLAVALSAGRAVLGEAGRAAPTLDDAYIHFQYARAFAEGHPLRYHAAAPVSTGATSVLWPLVLAPFHKLGLVGARLTWAAWGLSFVALFLLARDAAALVRPLAGRTGAATAALLVATFGGHVWCAASGMEVVPFAWLAVATLRRTADWLEGARGRRPFIHLVVLANLVALARPEGALFSCVAAAGLILAPATSAGSSRTSFAVRVRGLACFVAPTVVVAVLARMTGGALSNTASAKLLASSPYLSGASYRAAIAENVATFFGPLLGGEAWAAEFVPSGGAALGVAGVAATIVLGARCGKLARGVLIALLAAAMLIPCLYITFLWNRLRYLWPFATGWLLGLVCLAHLVGRAAGRLGLGARGAEALCGGALVGLFAAKLPWVIDDVARSASGIDRQQAAAGRWIAANLPPEARVGVNDAGAIAYFGNRTTFDIVGLTTTGEARHYLAGPASRLEHYERLGAARLPTHWAVYPAWLGLDATLGTVLRDFTVDDATILGGRTKVVARADWSLLGSGERPWSTFGGRVVDSVDVADLESEAAHEYALGSAREGQQVVGSGVAADGLTRLDGGRGWRTVDRFVLAGIAGHGHMLVARVEVDAPTRVTLIAAGSETSASLLAGEWSEIAMPLDGATGRTAVEVRFSEPARVFHYWLVAMGPR